jgi:hypothetical protein
MPARTFSRNSKKLESRKAHINIVIKLRIVIKQVNIHDQRVRENVIKFST